MKRLANIAAWFMVIAGTMNAQETTARKAWAIDFGPSIYASMLKTWKHTHLLVQQ